MVALPPCPNFCYGFVGRVTYGISRRTPCIWRACPYERFSVSEECLRHLRFFEFDSLVWGGDLGLEDFNDDNEEAPVSMNVVSRNQLETQAEKEETVMPGQKWCELHGCPRPAYGRRTICKYHHHRIQKLSHTSKALQFRKRGHHSSVIVEAGAVPESSKRTATEKTK